MPRAFLKKKNRGGTKIFMCTKCRKPILAGDQYYTWKFNHGNRYFLHATHGAPLPSSLSTGKMSPIWDAVVLFDVSGADSALEVKAALQGVADAAREVAAEYGKSADTIEESWPSGNTTSHSCRATQEALVEWADSLESWDAGSQDEIDEMREEASALLDDQPEYQG